MADSNFADHTVLITGPSFKIDLAPLDGLHPVNYSRRLLIFRCTSDTQRHAQLAALKTGLQAFVLRCPVVGGTVVPLFRDGTQDGEVKWHNIVPGKGLELIVRDLRKTMPSFEELEADNFPDRKLPGDLLLPLPKDLEDKDPWAAGTVQVSAIEGGTILTWVMSHSLYDGRANDELITLLSKETSLAQKEANDFEGQRERFAKLATEHFGEDRTALSNIQSNIKFNIADHPAFKPPPISVASETEPGTPHPYNATGPQVAVLFHISSAGLAQLKQDATTEGEMISTHDALAALMWRSILLIRSRRLPSKESTSSAVSRLFMPSDARRHLNLPSTYIGNAVYQLGAYINVDELLSPSGLKHAARALRNTIKNVKPEYVASYMAHLRESWVEWGFMNTTPYDWGMGSNWTSTSIYSDDWGEAFGRVVRLRAPDEGGDAAFGGVLPKLPDGSAEVGMGAMMSEMEFLRGPECFGKYI